MGYVNQATSHSENIWNVLKDEIKATYKSIKNKDFLYFLREAEFKYNNTNKNYQDMITEFLACFNIIINFEEYGIEEDNNFYIY